MNKQKTENQSVEEKEVVVEETATSTNEGDANANMAEGEEQGADTVAEEAPKVEEIDWRDKYLRLQAEFDNFRKRTLREKMALIESGGSDVWKAVLPVLDDMERAIAASEKSEDITALREGEKLIYNKLDRKSVV